MRRTAVLIGLCVSLAGAGIAVAQSDVVVKGGKYKGFTKQGHYIHFKVDNSGDFIVKLAYKLEQQCTNGMWQAYRANTTVACPAANPATFTGPDTNSISLAVQGLAAWGKFPRATSVPAAETRKLAASTTNQS